MADFGLFSEEQDDVQERDLDDLGEFYSCVNMPLDAEFHFVLDNESSELEKMVAVHQIFDKMSDSLKFESYLLEPLSVQTLILSKLMKLSPSKISNDFLVNWVFPSLEYILDKCEETPTIDYLKNNQVRHETFIQLVGVFKHLSFETREFLMNSASPKALLILSMNSQGISVDCFELRIRKLMREHRTIAFKCIANLSKLYVKEMKCLVKEFQDHSPENVYAWIPLLETDPIITDEFLVEVYPKLQSNAKCVLLSNMNIFKCNQALMSKYMDIIQNIPFVDPIIQYPFIINFEILPNYLHLQFENIWFPIWSLMNSSIV